MSSAVRGPYIKQGSCVPVARRGNSKVRKWRPNKIVQAVRDEKKEVIYGH